jgi:hypothetical protein
MGLEKGEKGSSKVLLYPAGEKDYVLYEGEWRFTALRLWRLSVYDSLVFLDSSFMRFPCHHI